MPAKKRKRPAPKARKEEGDAMTAGEETGAGRDGGPDHVGDEELTGKPSSAKRAKLSKAKSKVGKKTELGAENTSKATNGTLGEEEAEPAPVPDTQVGEAAQGSSLTQPEADSTTNAADVKPEQDGEQDTEAQPEDTQDANNSTEPDPEKDEQLPEAEPEPKRKAKSKPRGKAVSRKTSKAESESDHTETEPESGLQGNAELGNDAKPRPKSKPKGKAGSRAPPKSEAQPEDAPEPTIPDEPKPDEHNDSVESNESKSRAKSREKPETQTEADSDSLVHTEMDVDSGLEPKSKSQEEASIEPGSLSEAEQEPLPKAKSKPRGKAGSRKTSKVEAEPDSDQNETEPETKSKPKPKSKPKGKTSSKAKPNTDPESEDDELPKLTKGKGRSVSKSKLPETTKTEREANGQTEGESKTVKKPESKGKARPEGKPKGESKAKLSEEEFCHWLIKSEPETRMQKGVDVKFGFDDLLQEPDQTACWDGVRNHQAKNFLANQMKEGHECFFYHSNCKVPGIVGVAKVVKEGYPDHTQFDKKDPHYDPTAKRDAPRWFMVDVQAVRRLTRYIPLPELKALHQQHKATGGPLAKIALFTQARLSVSPLRQEEWDFIMTLENSDENKE